MYAQPGTAPPSAQDGKARGMDHKEMGNRAGDYDEEAGDLQVGTIVSNCPVDIRLGFLRKVYGILSCQLLCTLAFIAAFTLTPALKTMAQTNTALYMIGVGSTFAILIALYCVPGLIHQHPTNMALLAAFTVAESYLVAVITCFHNTTIVLQAVIITAAITVGLTMYTMQSKRDFSQMGSYLFVGLMVLIVGGILRIFFPLGSMGNLLFACFGALLFAGYIVFDTWMIMNQYGPDDYISASLSLYLDIVNLFIYILQILQSMQGED